mgnify:CR=1 FL=1
MPWKAIDLDKWAEELGISIDELRQKDRLIDTIVKTRKRLGISQAQLAGLVGVSQSRIAQLENRTRMSSISFDVLLRLLSALGHDYRITTRKASLPPKSRTVSAQMEDQLAAMAADPQIRRAIHT